VSNGASKATDKAIFADTWATSKHRLRVAIGFAAHGAGLARAIPKLAIARKPMPIEARRDPDEGRGFSANGDIGQTSGTRHLAP
jgi:hypothetical protein